MKKCLMTIALSMCAFTLFAGSNKTVPPSKNSNQNAPKIQVPKDETDVYAIPYDDGETEEDIEREQQYSRPRNSSYRN